MAQSRLNKYETDRVSKLVSLRLLEADENAMFDDIVKVAKIVAGAPIAGVSLIDDKRTWFKSCEGLTFADAPRRLAFCDHAIRSRAPLCIPDLTQDDRFATNPVVTDGPRLRMYAGIPLWTRDGYCLGTLCVMDTKSRTLSETQLDALEALARALMLNVESRQRETERQIDELLAKTIRPSESEIASSLNVGVYVMDGDGRCTFANEAALRITGLTREQAIGYGYFTNVMEEDRLELFEVVQAARVNREVFDRVYRVRFRDGSIRYLENYSAPHHQGVRIGTIIDVTVRVEREAALIKELQRLRDPSVIKPKE